MQTDILTGRPKIFEDISKRKEQEETKLIKDIDSATIVEGKLASKEGKYFLKLVEAGLAKRIDQLVKDDSEAKTLLSMIEALGGVIKVGKASAKRLMDLRLNR